MCYSYLKKLIDNSSQMNEESMKLLQFVCWENPHSSSVVLTEILWHIMYTYCQELKFYLDLLFIILSIEDSWQVLRIQNAMNGNGKYYKILCNILVTVLLTPNLSPKIGKVYLTQYCATKISIKDDHINV